VEGPDVRPLHFIIMKYRIITNGQIFRVQYYLILWIFSHWRNEKTYAGMTDIPLDFKTEREAKHEIYIKLRLKEWKMKEQKKYEELYRIKKFTSLDGKVYTIENYKEELKGYEKSESK